MKSEELKYILSYILGTDVEDINDSDTLRDGLGMDLTQMSDLVDILESKGVDVDGIDFESILTVEDLIEVLTSEEDL